MILEAFSNPNDSMILCQRGDGLGKSGHGEFVSMITKQNTHFTCFGSPHRTKNVLGPFSAKTQEPKSS